MNVIVYNDNKNIANLNIEIIKSIEGVHTVDELVGMFTNFFFNRMILDVTAIKEYDNYSNLKRLFETIDASKVILVLPDNTMTGSKEYISDLITLGVYNFTNKFEEIMNLYNNPRSYNDVESMHINKVVVEENKEEFTFKDFILPGEYDGNKKIIGVVNLTEHAGATTLVVQMIKQLNINYKAIGIEMNKQDFIYFNTPMIYSCMSKEDVLKKIKEHQSVDAVIVDLNQFDYKEFCTDIIYLIEPGVVKLTKLIRRKSDIFKDLSGEKIVLNRTNIKDGDLNTFEVESNLKIFSVVSNFRDNLDRVISVDKLLSKLGYVKCLKEEKRKLFGMFGKNS